jgi:hypothetical protein
MLSLAPLKKTSWKRLMPPNFLSAARLDMVFLLLFFKKENLSSYG